jgi:hypothetical protein
VLGRLQLWRVRWEKEQMEVFRYAHSQARVPPSLIQNEHNLLVSTCTLV